MQIPIVGNRRRNIDSEAAIKQIEERIRSRFLSLMRETVAKVVERVEPAPLPPRAAQETDRVAARLD